jgi:signal transduction histidine kinase
MLNTCFETTYTYHSIAYYSHLIPAAIALLLVGFVLSKSRSALLTKLFALLVLGFSLWLIGDVIIWTNTNYHLVTALWAPLDYINILFYLLAAYFFAVLVSGKDIRNWQKLALFAVSLPAWWITVTGQSIVDFYHPWCEASNNEFLTQYKLGVEVGVLALIMFTGLFSFFKSDKAKRKQISLVAVALVLFLAIFASTEYIASVTGIYEINLYSLFVLPVFLAMIIYSITNLRIFAYKSFGTQLLIYVLLIMVGSQFFFLNDATYRALTLVTLALSVFLGTVLARNIRREEELAIQLEVANEGQATLIHFINHQIKGFLNKGKIAFAEFISDPEYGQASDEGKKLLGEGLHAMNEGVDFVQEILKASDIEKGTFAYDIKPVDLKSIVSTIAEDMRSTATTKGLQYNIDIAPGEYNTKGDLSQLKEAVKNLITNSIVYTPTGSINIKLGVNDKKILLTIQDTGVGLSDEVKPKLFTKGGRSSESVKINVNSTGYGLAIVKGIAEAHKGRVWAESLGVNKGSTFYLELPVLA